MTQISYRANLSSKSFPFNAFLQGSTVIVPGADQVYTRYGTPSERIRDVNVPEIYYGHNFFPTVEGVAAIGYEYGISTAEIGGVPTLLDDYGYSYRPGNASIYAKRIITNVQVGTDYFYILECAQLVSTGPEVFTYTRWWYNVSKNNIPWWTLCTGIVPTLKNANANTYATINGTTYCFQLTLSGVLGGTIASFNGTGWVAAVLVGIAAANIKGILASNGYLIAYSNNSVAWSSTTNPLDFTPSTITGAGGGTVQELKGSILFAKSTAFGFILYTDINCVSATYTGNTRFPFKFTEIKGAGGGLTVEQVAGDLPDGSQIVYTRKGLQILNANSAENYLPEFNDFIKSGTLTTYDTSTDTFTSTYVSGLNLAGSYAYTFTGKLAFLHNRYLTYSYRTTAPTLVSGTQVYFTELYEYILIYDTQLDRWGHFKRKHIDCFEAANNVLLYSRYGGPAVANLSDNLTLGSSDSSIGIGLLADSGCLSVAVTQRNCDDAVVIMGKYKYVRNKRLIVDKVKLENYSQYPTTVGGVPVRVPTVNCKLLSSYEGNSLLPVVSGYRLTTSTLPQQEFLFSQEGYNHSLVITGAFNLTSVSIDLHTTGTV